MGKPNHKPRHNHNAGKYSRLDQRNVSDGPSAAELGRILPIKHGDSSGVDADLANRNDANNGSFGEPGHSVPKHESDLCGLNDDGIRVYRGETCKVERSFDAKAFNAILNHPDIKQNIYEFNADKNISIDISHFVENKNNILFNVDSGGLLFIKSGENTFWLVGYFLPSVTIEYVYKVAQNCYHWIFVNTNCTVIDCRLHQPSTLTQKSIVTGFLREVFRRHMQCYTLSYNSWIVQSNLTETSGNEFIAHFEPGKLFDIEHPFPTHAGAFVEMIYGGFPEKAVAIYNRFAQLGEFQQFSMISRDPLLFDIGVAILQFFPEKRDFKVLKCK